jgi:phenylalanyl-tRNA synthetase alpha chain
MNKTSYSNIAPFIEERMDFNLHNEKNHPICIVKEKVYKYLCKVKPFQMFDNLSPIVSVEDNFDKLLIPPDHPARSKSDTYYVNEHEVLRTQTSAHQTALLSQGYENFLVCGPVFRKDEVDATHYPIFHQIEIMVVCDDIPDEDCEKMLKDLLSGLVQYLFPGCSLRYNPDYFPFTHTSYEMEVLFQDKWIEVLGCGIVQPKILENCGLKNKKAIAAGFGLDRLAMIFCQIPDIRYIWSRHEKFLEQFGDGKLNQFKKYSVLNDVEKDVSFFIPAEQLDDKNWLKENDFFDFLRGKLGDLIKSVKLFDSFYNPKLKKFSRTYRLVYSAVDPKMNNPATFNENINKLHRELGMEVSAVLGLELR